MLTSTSFSPRSCRVRTTKRDDTNQPYATPLHLALPSRPQQLLLEGVRQRLLVNHVLAGHAGVAPLQVQPVRGVADQVATPRKL